jgi:hypothetical protein
MRINIPASSHPITRLLIDTPLGRTTADFLKGVSHFDYEIPEGISIEEVGVAYEFRGNGRSSIDGGILKYAIEKPADPIVPVVDIPQDEEVEHSLLPTDDGCGCVKDEGEACSNCDPEDEIALGE